MPYEFIREYLKDPEIGEPKLRYYKHMHKEMETHEGVHDVEHVMHLHIKPVMLPYYE